MGRYTPLSRVGCPELAHIASCRPVPRRSARYFSSAAPPNQQPRLISWSTLPGMSKIALAAGGGGYRRSARGTVGLNAGAMIACCFMVKCSPSHGPFSNGVDDAARSSVELMMS